jgi:F0F1-type ATP synthase membrane subunit b/b'
MNLSFFLSHESFFEFNTNILETNTINIFLLIALLVYVKKTSFDPNLESRQKEIVQSIENAQKELIDSFQYYEFCENLYKQSFFWLDYWKKSYQSQKLEIVELKYNSVKKFLEENMLTTKILLRNFEKKAFLSLQKSINYLVASKILRKFFTLTEKEQIKLMEVTVSTLGGKQ